MKSIVKAKWVLQKELFDKCQRGQTWGRFSQPHEQNHRSAGTNDRWLNTMKRTDRIHASTLNGNAPSILTQFPSTKLWLAIVDTNSDPNAVDFAIPANDDAFKSVSLLVKAFGTAIEEGLSERKKDKDDAKLSEEEEAKRAVDAETKE